jgi:hypothetical protein
VQASAPNGEEPQLSHRTTHASPQTPRSRPVRTRTKRDAPTSSHVRSVRAKRASGQD